MLLFVEHQFSEICRPIDSIDSYNHCTNKSGMRQSPAPDHRVEQILYGGAEHFPYNHNSVIPLHK
jgi:hypothetical protein